MACGLLECNSWNGACISRYAKRDLLNRQKGVYGQTGERLDRVLRQRLVKPNMLKSEAVYLGDNLLGDREDLITEAHFEDARTLPHDRKKFDVSADQVDDILFGELCDFSLS